MVVKAVLGKPREVRRPLWGTSALSVVHLLIDPIQRLLG